MTDHRTEVWDWLRSEDGSALLARLRSEPLPLSVASVSSLRKSFSHDQVSATIELTHARARAAAKFGRDRAAQLWCDDHGVQMASSPLAARYKAGRYLSTLGEGAPVVDLCCGIGGDLIELTDAKLQTLGVDLDPARAWMASQNSGAPTRACDVLDPSLPGGAFHLDPARRSGSGRSRAMDSFEPGPDVWDEIVSRRGDGCLKLNPGLRFDEAPHGEVEIVSENGSLTQGLVWTGSFHTTTRRATLLTDDGVCSVEGEPERIEDSNPLGEWIATLDPSIERADLVPTLIDELGTVSLVHPGAGLLTSAQPADHPMLGWYRVLDELGWNRKRVKSALRDLDARIVTVKTRAKVCDPDVEHKALRGAGSRDLVVFVQPIGDSIRAIICEPFANDNPRHRVDTGGRGAL